MLTKGDIYEDLNLVQNINFDSNFFGYNFDLFLFKLPDL